MILIIDEFVNTHPEATVVVWGGMIDWYDLPEQIRNIGPADGWDENHFGQMALRCIIRPLQAANAPELPSTVAARKLFPDIDYDDEKRTRGIIWNQQHEDPNEQMPPWSYGLPVADAIAPNFDQASAYKYGAIVSSYDTCYVAIIQADGQILLNAINLIPYKTMDTVNDVQAIPIDETHFLHLPPIPNDNRPRNVQDLPDYHVPVNFALRITNWLLPASTSSDELNQRLSEPLPYRSWPERPQTGKSQTLLLHDQAPMYEKFKSNGLRGNPEILVPTSPLYHIAILAGSSVMMFQRGVTDFRNEEIRYEQQLEQEILARRNLAWGAFNSFLVDILRIELMAAPQIPGWIKAPVNYWLTELGDRSPPSAKTRTSSPQA